MQTKNSNVFASLGVNHNKPKQRVEQDFYTTEPQAVKYLLKIEKFNKNIWEPACGNGNIVSELRKKGYNVKATDITNRGCPESTTQDFLKTTKKFQGDIITNPPYTHVTEFIKQAYKLTQKKVAMFLKIQFLESIQRYEEIFSKYPPKTVNIFVKRIPCYRNDDRTKKQSAVCYTWMIWDKKHHGKTTINWIPNHKD